MKKILSLIAVLSLVIASLFGCASIVSKSVYPVSINSKPDGAEIIIKNKAGETVFNGKTPTTVSLKAGAGYFKGEDYIVTFKKDGYSSHEAQVKRDLDGWYIAGNIVFGGLIGWFIVDPATGAMWTLKNLNVDLKELSTSASNDSIQIISLDQVPEHLRSEMVLIN